MSFNNNKLPVKGISPLRRNVLSPLLTKYKLNDNESVYLDILKDLCSDIVKNEDKLDLLLLLEEQESAWLLTSESIEQVVGSLHSLYKQLSDPKDALLGRQVLITSTVILLTASDPDTNPQLCELLFKHVDHLLQIVGGGTKKISPLLKMAACQCLQEIEATFPNELSLPSTVELLWSACTRETSIAFQSYASLLAQILFNISKKSRENPVGRKDSTLTSLALAGATQMQEERLATSVTVREGPNVVAYSPGQETSLDVVPLAMYLVDLLPSLAPASLHLVLHCLLKIPTLHHPSFLMNLKMCWPSFLQSSSLPLVHLALSALQLGVAWSDPLGLVSLLATSSSHPLSPVSQRLLLLDWVHTVLQIKQIPEASLPTAPLQSVSGSKSDGSIRQAACFSWAPNAFDGADTQGKKLRLMAFLQPKERLERVLLLYLESLRKLGGRATVVLYKAMQHFYIQLHSLELENHICRVAVETLRISLGTVRHLLDFIEALQHAIPNSHLPEMLLERSTSWMTEVSEEETLLHLNSYLYALHKVADPLQDSPPARIKGMLQFLHVLLSCTGVHAQWLKGHQVLGVLRSLLHRKDIMLLYADLCEVLFLLLSGAAAGGRSDVDVRSGAKSLYSALTSLSLTKVCHLFPLDTTKGNLGLSHFISENSSSFPSANAVNDLPERVIEIQRCPRSVKDEAAYSSFIDSNLDISGKVLDLDMYFEKWHSVAVPLKFELKLCPDRAACFRVLYGLSLEIQHMEHSCLPIQPIEIPALTEQHENEGHVFELLLRPLKVQPLSLKFIAELTTQDCRNFRGELCIQRLPLASLLLPLPLAPSLRPHLFQQLWHSPPGLHEESSCFLKIPCHHLMSHWQPYLLSHGEMGPKVIEDSPQKEVEAAMFLVPSSHVLVKVRPQGDASVQVLFKVDNPQALPWFYEYLQSLVA